MNEALICDLKRFAVHDGPGVRSTLFLKGCPLHCAWCHNPESIAPAAELGIRRHKCTGCGECARVCSCHSIGADGEHRFDRARCRACGRCVEACLFGALVLYGRRISVGEAMTELLEDRVFYESSGGGVTLSGGEPLLQAAFCAELLAELKRERIHTALDTCGNVPWRNLEAVLPVTDLFLYDFKHFDPVRHRELTGCDNRTILANLIRLGSCGVPIEIRMPMVPGENMEEELLRRSAALLASVSGIVRVRLLAYHSLARSKYDAVGRPDTMPLAAPPTRDGLNRAAELLRAHGLTVLLPDD